MSSNDFQEFKQWQEFKKMKEMMATASTFVPAPPAPPAPPVKTFAQILATTPAAKPAPPPLRVFAGAGGSSKSSDDSLPTFRKTYKIDWERIMRWTILMTPQRGEEWSKHPNLYMLYRDIYNDFPERFSLIGELHADDDGRTYFSYRYQRPGEKCSSTFHAYGRLVGTKFFTDSVDIRIGLEAYPDAAKFKLKD